MALNAKTSSLDLVLQIRYNLRSVPGSGRSYESEMLGRWADSTVHPSGQEAEGRETSMETTAVFLHMKSLLFNIILKICHVSELTRVISTQQTMEKESRQQFQAGAAQTQLFFEFTLCIEVIMGVSKRVRVKDTLTRLWKIWNNGITARQDREIHSTESISQCVQYLAKSHRINTTFLWTALCKALSHVISITGM